MDRMVAYLRFLREVTGLFRFQVQTFQVQTAEKRASRNDLPGTNAELCEIVSGLKAVFLAFRT
ncbi:MAG: hypothetical protein GYA33_11345 [Thermogutta sp.]|nr:hypothetical protein [Thermogutta sp.]